MFLIEPNNDVENCHKNEKNSAIKYNEEKKKKFLGEEKKELGLWEENKIASFLKKKGVSGGQKILKIKNL